MPIGSRLEELRRRIEKDPASILFAQFAEELRRAGQVHDAAEVLRAGLAHHPNYLSARVMLGRVLVDLDQLEEAERELAAVRKIAPDNLAALRALGLLADRRRVLELETRRPEEAVLSVLERWLDAIHVARAHPVA